MVGMRFQKRFSFGPLRLNLSKSGAGLSLGIPGARVGVGPRGPYTTFGIPGSGLSHTSRTPWLAIGLAVGLALLSLAAGLVALVFVVVVTR
jgi:hypothetical protein